MMIRIQNHRGSIMVAAVIAIAGIVVAWRALGRARPVSADRPAQSVARNVRDTLDSLTMEVHPSVETIVADVGRAADRVVEQVVAQSGSGTLAHGRIEDLSAALRERLMATLASDYDRDVRALQNRGITIPDDTTGQERDTRKRQAALTHMAPFSIDQMRVRGVYEKGQLIGDSLPGFSTLTTTRNTGMPVSLDAETARLDVVEVLVPMITPTVDGKQSRVIVGYRFAWNEALSQWVPWTIVQYHDPNETHFGIIF